MAENLKRTPRASVAMAVYNGERYLREQLDSIVEMLGEHDEIVVSYDKSSDATRQILSEYEKKDFRIKVFDNEKRPGVRGNFSNAVGHCQGEYIFLSDQDDIWINDKIEKVVGVFEETKADLVVHDGFEADCEMNMLSQSMFAKERISPKALRNFISSTASGCCMAFRRDMCDVLLDFPENNAHDVWTMMICASFGKVFLLYEALIIHRLHGNNVTTPRRKLAVVAWDRLTLFIRYVLRCLRRILKTK